MNAHIAFIPQVLKCITGEGFSSHQLHVNETWCDRSLHLRQFRVPAGCFSYRLRWLKTDSNPQPSCRPINNKDNCRIHLVLLSHRLISCFKRHSYTLRGFEVKPPLSVHFDRADTFYLFLLFSQNRGYRVHVNERLEGEVPTFAWKVRVEKNKCTVCQSLEKFPPSPVTSDLFPLVVVNQEYVWHTETEREKKQPFRLYIRGGFWWADDSCNGLFCISSLSRRRSKVVLTPLSSVRWKKNDHRGEEN